MVIMFYLLLMFVDWHFCCSGKPRTHELYIEHGSIFILVGVAWRMLGNFL